MLRASKNGSYFGTYEWGFKKRLMLYQGLVNFVQIYVHCILSVSKHGSWLSTWDLKDFSELLTWHFKGFILWLGSSWDRFGFALIPKLLRAWDPLEFRPWPNRLFYRFAHSARPFHFDRWVGKLLGCLLFASVCLFCLCVYVLARGFCVAKSPPVLVLSCALCRNGQSWWPSET